MLSAIQTLFETKIMAADADRQWDAPFSCPACGSPVILKQGRIITPHFAHKPPVTCEYGLGESEQHRIIKTEIFNALRDHGKAAVELEKRLGPAITDIYFETKSGQKIAVEVQISKLTMDKIIARTMTYHQLGVYVLWLVPWKDELNERRYSPSQYEKWLHVLNFGKVYYHLEGLEVVPVHFAPYELEVPESGYYDSTGNYNGFGGYKRKSKRYRTPIQDEDTVNIATDFQSRTTVKRDFGGFSIPSARIYMVKQ